jgi:ubiquinone/menaquinone biosynthesis C-methylase UbiE
MATKLAIAYAVGLEVIYRARSAPYGGTAIDLACGPGHFSLCLARYLKLDLLEGVDLSEPMVRAASANAMTQGAANVRFRLGDVTQLGEISDDYFELSTFCDAAHHMPDLATVSQVLSEMDRITKADGLVFIMDLVRLKTAKITDDYVSLLGRDYHRRGWPAFYEDFHNSMYAAWTAIELASAVPKASRRQWICWKAVGLPSIQLLIGLPHSQGKRLLRSGFPWQPEESVVERPLRAEWRLMRRSLLTSPARKLM